MGQGALHEYSAEAAADGIINGRREAPAGWAATAGATEGIIDWGKHRARTRGTDTGLPNLGDIPTLTTLTTLTTNTDDPTTNTALANTSSPATPAPAPTAQPTGTGAPASIPVTGQTSGTPGATTNTPHPTPDTPPPPGDGIPSSSTTGIPAPLTTAPPDTTDHTTGSGSGSGSGSSTFTAATPNTSEPPVNSGSTAADNSATRTDPITTVLTDTPPVASATTAPAGTPVVSTPTPTASGVTTSATAGTDASGGSPPPPPTAATGLPFSLTTTVLNPPPSTADNNASDGTPIGTPRPQYPTPPGSGTSGPTGVTTSGTTSGTTITGTTGVGSTGTGQPGVGTSPLPAPGRQPTAHSDDAVTPVTVVRPPTATPPGSIAVITPDPARPTKAQNPPPSTASTLPSIGTNATNAGPTGRTGAVAAATTDSGSAPTSADGTAGQAVGRPDTDTVGPTAAASADAHRADAAWADAMLPVLEMQLNHVSQEQTAPDAAEVRETLTRLAALVEEARQAGELPPASVTQTLVSAPPEQMRKWQETAQEHAAAQAAAARTTDDPTARARHWLNSVLYQGFPMQTGARNLDPGRVTDADFLPLVQQVLDPSISEVDSSHLGRLREHVETLVERGNPVTLDALKRREGFELLKGRLDDLQALDETSEVLHRDRRIVQTLSERGVAADRQLEMRGLARDLLVERDLRFDLTEQNLATLNQVTELAYRRYLKTNDGAVPAGPLRLSHLQDLLQHKLGERGTLTWGNLQRIVDQATARQQWRDRHPLLARGSGVVRSLTAASPALREAGIYRSVVERHARTIQRQPGQADSPDQRRRELEHLWNLMSPETSAGASASTSLDPEGITRSDVARLVDTRRRLYADSRFRWYTGPSDYRSMALELLGAGRVGPAEMRQLATMVRTARANTRALRTDLRSTQRYSDSVLRRRLTELATVQWQDGKPGARPMVPGVVVDHSRLVTAFHSIGELAFVPELTAWLNHSVPFGTGAITEEVVSRTLASQFGQVLDDGAALTATVDGNTYDIRLWAVATGEPVVEDGSLLGLKESGSTRFSGKQEKRVYRYRDTATWQTSTRGLSVDAGVAYRGDVGVPEGISAARLDVGATVGGMKTWGHRQLAANTTADYLQFRIKEPLGWTNLPVGWVVRVQDRQTGRWRELTLQDEHGRLREHQVPYAGSSPVEWCLAVVA
ncbi:hypothetical protein V6U90_21165 [Micromonospora sp. CPCC 206060]|uniref:hypothetical protein n=1 Tax=Micromonospora sp. CPCC 206060 TaxID=3122406 RepID=UPI002FF287FC